METTPATLDELLDDLRPQRAAFVREYLVDLNAKQAAIRAGYSPKTAKAQGHRLLTDADVRTAVDAGKAERAARLEVTADRVLAELARLGFANALEYHRIGPDGDPVIDLEGLTPDQAAAIVALKVDTYTEGRGEESREVKRVEIKLADKIRALELMAKHLGMLVDRVDHRHSGTLDVRNLSDAELEELAGYRAADADPAS